MSLYILIFVEFVFLILMYGSFDRDIISPPVISTLTILIGTIFVIPSSEIWHTSISENTFTVIITGFVVMWLSSVFAKILFKKRKINRTKQSMKLIHCCKFIERVICIFSIVLTALYLWDAVRVGTLNGGGGGLASIAYMKSAYMNDNGERMNPVIRQGFKVVMMFAYISCLLFANNVLVLKEKFTKNIAYFIAIICGAIITLASGSRTEILRILSALLLCYSILTREHGGWKVKENTRSFIQVVRKFTPVILLFAVVAFSSKAFVKTEGTATSNILSIGDYLSYYVGSPIQVLNDKLAYFRNLDELVFGTTSQIPVFTYLGNLDYGGNVATLFGYILVFTEYNGLLIMTALLFLNYFIGTALYYKIYGSHTSEKRNFGMVLYSYVYYIFVMSFYSCTALSLFYVSNILLFLLIIILYKPIVKIKWKF